MGSFPCCLSSRQWPRDWNCFCGGHPAGRWREEFTEDPILNSQISSWKWYVTFRSIIHWLEPVTRLHLDEQWLEIWQLLLRKISVIFIKKRGSDPCGLLQFLQQCNEGQNGDLSPETVMCMMSLNGKNSLAVRWWGVRRRKHSKQLHCY